MSSILAAMKKSTRSAPAPSFDERIASLSALERSLARRKDDVVRAIARDFGVRSKHESLIVEVFGVRNAIKHTKAHLYDWMQTEERAAGWMFMPSTCAIMRQPLGVVGIISPWNYPVHLAIAPLVAALAAGNKAMLKPSELVPAAAKVIEEIIAEALPSEQVAVVTGGADVGEAFAKLPFDHLFFTGSTRVGKLVMRAASENLVPVTLELGGKSPAIVGPDSSARAAAERIILGKTFNAGQTCIAPDYALVPTGARRAFVDACRAMAAKAYPSFAANDDYTAIINDEHYARLASYVDDARARGGEVVELVQDSTPRAALAKARKMNPTLILNPTDAMLCMKEEIFGPILPIVTYAALQDAISFVNDRPRPLAVYYFGHDRAAIARVLSETVSGGVTINETMLHFLQDELPFGGVGASGMGQYHGRAGFDALSKSKPVFRQASIGARSLMKPPYGKLADRILGLLLGR